MEVRGQRHAPGALTPGKRPCTNVTEGWVRPRAGQKGCENLAPTGIRFSVASRYIFKINTALRYRPEGRGFDSQWCKWNFLLT
jgi:hypothetical protein